jgi:hypothetical protein
MRVEEAVASIYGLPGSWARLECFRRTSGTLELCFGIHKGKRGGKIGAWRVACLGVHEAKITALDGGGIALYPATHPAARGCVARLAEVRWSGPSDHTALLGALYQAHTKLVGDWIPFEWYSTIQTIKAGNFCLRGPDFLMRAYAKVLRSCGKQPRLILRMKPHPKSVQPRVLHFGDSYVVADTFTAERNDEQEPTPRRIARTGRKTVPRASRSEA